MKHKMFNKIKNFFYALPFGLKGADSEIMGNANNEGNNGTTINQEISEHRVAKHLLKGEITNEVEELRYRTYKVDREADNYMYVGSSDVAVKKKKKASSGSTRNKNIKFTHENKLVCNDILTELKHVDGYGVETYTTEINYTFPVRYKLEQFMKAVDVVIDGKKSTKTTLRFDDIPNPDDFKSKPFLNELSNLHKAFLAKDEYGINRCEYTNGVLCMNFFTLKSDDDEKSAVSYGFKAPTLVDVKHSKGEYKLTYEWADYERIDLTDKFFNAELEAKYKAKEKKETPKSEIQVEDNKDTGIFKTGKIIKCSSCGKELNTYYDGVMFDVKAGLPLCVECYRKNI